jgi:hypothetical protein
MKAILPSEGWAQQELFAIIVALAAVMRKTN